MSNSRSRIPSPARSMPLTPRRRETPRKTRSVCSPARSNASYRLSTIVREHREAMDSLGLSPLNRRSVLNDNTDIDEPGRKSWWKELGDNSQDVMEVLKDNIVEPHNIFDNIEVLSQEEKHHTVDLDMPDCSDSESIQSIIIPQRKLFYEKENQPQKQINPFGTRETLEKHDRASITNVDKTISATTSKNKLLQNNPPTRPIFPAALLNISTNSTASEKTMTFVEPKRRVHNLFNNQKNENKSQAIKRKNMFTKFIESDSEEELPEIQPKFFALQRKTDSRRPSLASRALDATLTSSMDIEMDDWQLLPSSTMVDHQLNTTLTAGHKPTRLRLSKLSEAEIGSNSSDTSQTKSSRNKSNVQDKSPKQNTSIVTRNRSKTLNNIDEEINKRQSKSPSSPKASQSPILTRNKNKSDIANKSQNASINKSRTSNKSKDASNISIKPTADKNAVSQKTSKSLIVPNLNENEKIVNKTRDNELKEDDELNFSLQYDEDNVNEFDDENVTKNASVIDNSNKKMDNSKNVAQTDSGESNKSNISSTVKDVQKMHNKAIEESGDISDHNKSHTSAQNLNENKVLEQAGDVEDKVNKSQNDKTVEMEHDGNKESEEQNQEVGQENIVDKEADIETYEGSKDTQNDIQGEKESNELHEIQEKHVDSHEKQNDNQDEENKSEGDQNSSRGKQKENESQDMQNENQELLNKIIEEQNEIQDEQNESLEGQVDESQEIPNDTEKEENQSEEENNVSEEENNESEIENNESEEENIETNNDSEEEIVDEQEEIEQNESEVKHSEIECEDANESIDAAAESDQNNTQENDIECDDANECEDAIAESDQNDIEENESEEENNSENETADESVEAAAKSDHNDSQENEIDEENDMEDADVNESLEVTAESDQNDVQENKSEHEVDDQIDNTESPNVSHDTTGRYRKKSTPEAVLRESRNEIDLTRVHGRNTSARKTKSLIQRLNRPSLEPARESMEFSAGAENSSAEGSGWDSHRTTRKTLRQTFGKDFTPRKSLRALVMEKSAKRRATAINDTAAKPQANSTEFPEPDASNCIEPDVTNDYEMATDLPVQEVSMRTRQMKLVECLERAKKDWAEMDAKAKAIVKQRLEHIKQNRKVEDPFKLPPAPWFARQTKPKEKTKNRLKPLISLENMPEEFIEDMKYKPPKRFAPRNAAWLTKRLYKFLETKLEPKYNYKARVRAEKFAQTLYEFVQSLKRRGAPAVAPPLAVEALKREMARLNFVKTHYDFYNFFHDYMPREVRIKVNPDIVNNIPHPKNGIFSDIL